MPVFPNPSDPRIDALLQRLPNLGVAKWIEIAQRANGPLMTDAAEIAYGIVSGSELLISNAEKTRRLAAAEEAYARIPAGVADIPEMIKHDGHEMPLRGLVATAAQHHIAALLAAEDLNRHTIARSLLARLFD